MINITNNANCCGCGACSQACPVGCIQMKSDREGFLYPHLDMKKCVNCHLCEKVCPIITKKNVSNKVQSSYAAFSKDEDLLKVSSSGAIFSELSIYVFNNGGVVFGAAFDENMMVKHICIDKKEDLNLLQGSKYLQSNMGEAFKSAKKLLDKGQLVLFTGTACQISGLKSFLAKEYDNLLTVDVLCHGVPSPLLWKKYLTEMRRKNSNKKVVSVLFRDKTSGWNNYSHTVVFENGYRYSENHNSNLFMKLFLSNICLRPACHNCRFKELERQSDITIGDCWGIEKTLPEMNNENGVSVILTHTNKGDETLKMISDRVCIKECDTDIVLPPTSDARNSVLPHRNRKKFFKKLRRTRNVSGLVKCLAPPLKTRIIKKIQKVI